MANDLPEMNDIQEEIFWGAWEESGLWEIISSIAQIKKVDRQTAFNLLQNEIDFINSNTKIYLIYSKKLYDSKTATVLDKMELKNLTLQDAEFHEQGPFYYLSSVPDI